MISFIDQPSPGEAGAFSRATRADGIIFVSSHIDGAS